MALARRALSQVITRPADTTAYAAGDLIANSTTAGSVTPFLVDLKATGSGCRIRSILVRKSGATTANASFRVWLFDQTKAVTNGDNGAIAPTTMDGFLGSFTSTASLGGTAGAVSQLTCDSTEQWPATNTIYALLEARAALAPASGETFQLEFMLADESR